MTESHVRDVLLDYARRFPDRADDVRPLLGLIQQQAMVLSRKEARGHVTCGALVLNEHDHLLQIRHKFLNRWLTPGGHVELADATLLAGALRELVEETGLGPPLVSAAFDWPIDINCHPIPANPAKNEPPHDHWDFRFLFRVAPSHEVKLDQAEVTDSRWIGLDQLANDEPMLGSAIRLAVRVSTPL